MQIVAGSRRHRSYGWTARGEAEPTALSSRSEKAFAKMELDALLQRELTDVLPNSVTSVEVELDLGALELKNQILESFDDLIARKQFRFGILYELTKLRLMLCENGKLRIINKYTGPTDTDYSLKIEILLTKAGFENIAILQQNGHQVVEAIRRPYLVELYRNDLIVREIVEPADCLRCHDFAQEYFYFKDYNYNIEIARQFDLNSDMFAVFDKSNRILAIGRSAARVPGYYCPFMYATEQNGQHIIVPPEFVRFCEVMVLFRDGKMGSIAFKCIVEILLKFYYENAHYDSFWTTYDVTDIYTGVYYKKRFQLSDYHKILVYRDFGGNWNLINTKKIKELYETRRTIFR